MRLDEADQAALDVIRDVNLEKYQLERQVEIKAEEYRREIFKDWDERMTQAVTYAKNRGIANRQIGRACRTTNNATAKQIVDKYWANETPESPSAGVPTPGARVVVTGTRTHPLLTLNEWEVHADTPTVGDEPRTLTTQEFALRYREKTDMWLAVDTSDGVPLVLSRELMNRASELQSSIRTQVDALPEAE